MAHKSDEVRNMRQYLIKSKKLVRLIDFGHYQVFDNSTTYTIISMFDNTMCSDTFEYLSFNAERNKNSHVDNLSYNDIFINGKFYLADKDSLNQLKEIKVKKVAKYAIVKNGFATLSDDIFIKNVPFKAFTIPIIKASTGKWHQGFFPYNNNGKPISKDVIFNDKDVADYLNNHKAQLLKGKSEEDNPYWYLYGRTQALKDVFTLKTAINTIIKDVDGIKLNQVGIGCGLYSGLYIISRLPYESIERLIKTYDFIQYLTLLKNYKSGGYYTYNSKDLEQYINYKISKDDTARNYLSTNEQNLFERDFKIF